VTNVTDTGQQTDGIAMT